MFLLNFAVAKGCNVNFVVKIISFYYIINYNITSCMIRATATIRNSAGIHVRPSALIIETIKDYPGKIILKTDRMKTVLATAIDLLSLGLLRGDTVDIEVIGPQEKSICTKVKRLFETEFDFPPRK